MYKTDKEENWPTVSISLAYAGTSCIIGICADFLLVIAVVLSVFAIDFISLKGNYSGIELVFAETSILCFPISLLIVYYVSSGSGIICRTLESKCLLYVGSLSMYTFLIHQQVILYLHMIWSNLISEQVNVYLLSVVAIIVTWVATLVYTMIEKKVKGE